MPVADKSHHHIAALDGLRGLAVTMVFLFHYGGGSQSSNMAVHAFGVADKAGWSGVTLFYGLSGFLITGILWDSFGQSHWRRNFYMRRVLRIFPLYYAALAVLVLAGSWQHALNATLNTAGVFAVFCQNMPFYTLPLRVAAPVFHLGSIAVEEQFYLLWPLLLLLVRRRRDSLRWGVVLCVAAFVASLLFRMAVLRWAADPGPWLTTSLARGGELAAGGALALLYRGRSWEGLRRAAPVVGIVSLAVFVGCSLHSGGFALQGSLQWTLGLAAITLSFASLLVLAIAPGRVQRLVSARWLQWLGRISYGVYVFHILILHFVNQAAVAVAHTRSGSRYEVLRFVIAAVASVALAWLSYRFYERPFLGLKRRYPSPPPARSGAPVC